MQTRISNVSACYRPLTVGLLAFGVAALVGAGAPPAWAANGWQGGAVFDVPAGQVSQFVHEDCPGTLKATDGAFEFNSVGQTDSVFLGYNGPRFDESPANLNEWGWHFYWPSGAKSGETITFSVHCEKG
jgi:hypothetical protein